MTRSYTWGPGAPGTANSFIELTNYAYDANWDLLSTTDYFPTSDGNGNVASLVRYDGVTAAVYEYGPFGETLQNQTPSSDTTVSDNPIRSASNYTDAETGLISYGRRYYNPALGRFLGRDPIAEKGGLHLYAFAGNNGINRWDYLGMDPQLNYGGYNTNPLSLGASGTIYPPGSVAAALYGNGAVAGTQAYLNEVQVKETFYGNMGNGHGSGSGANSISGASEIPGSSEVYAVSSGNSVSDWENTLSFTKTYVVNDKSYTVSNDPHAAPTDGGSAFNVNANTGAFSSIANGNVNIGALQNLGTVGNDPIGPATSPIPSTSQPDLTPDQIGAIYDAQHSNTNSYGNQAFLNAIGQNMQSSGTGQTLTNGADLGDDVAIASTVLLGGEGEVLASAEAEAPIQEQVLQQQMVKDDLAQVRGLAQGLSDDQMDLLHEMMADAKAGQGAGAKLSVEEISALVEQVKQLYPNK